MERHAHALANKMDKAAEAIKQYHLEWLKLQGDLDAAVRNLAGAKESNEAILQLSSDKDSGPKSQSTSPRDFDPMFGGTQAT